MLGLKDDAKQWRFLRKNCSQIAFHYNIGKSYNLYLYNLDITYILYILYKLYYELHFLYNTSETENGKASSSIEKSALQRPAEAIVKRPVVYVDGLKKIIGSSWVLGTWGETQRPASSSFNMERASWLHCWQSAAPDCPSATLPL